MRTLSSWSCSILVASTALVACGGGMPKASPPAASEMRQEEQPSSIAEAQDQIARARADLDRTQVRDGKKTSESTPADATSSTTSPPAKSVPSGGSIPGSMRPTTPPHDAVVAPKAEDTCGSPCKAIASMRRAVTALCRMTGDEDGRCVDAKRTLSSSEARVASCPCAKP